MNAFIGGLCQGGGGGAVDLSSYLTSAQIAATYLTQASGLTAALAASTYLTQAAATTDYAAITHASRHKSGGADAIKIDELAAGTDVTTLDASVSLHGLMPKGDNNTAHFYRGDLTQATPDHGTIGGLGDDDHTIYSLVSGARAFTGAVSGTSASWTTTAIGTAQTVGGLQQNTTAATSGNQQYSPVVAQAGFGFGTGANTSQEVRFGWQVRPVQAATNPTGFFDLLRGINGASLAAILSVTSTGQLALGNGTAAAPAIYGGTTNTGIFFSAGVPAVTITGTGLYFFGASSFSPEASGTRTLGASGTRWLTMFSATADLTGALKMTEMTAPSGAANVATVYSDDLAGKTRLMVIFGSGTAIQLAIEV